MSEEGRYAATVYRTTLELQARGGPLNNTRYAYLIDQDAHYNWIANSTATADGVNTIQPSGGGQGRWLRVRGADAGAALTDADATIYVSAGRWRTLAAATLTADRILTLGTTAASAGDCLTVTRLDVGAFTYTVRNGGPGLGDVVMPISARAFVDMEFDGTNWLQKRSGLML